MSFEVSQIPQAKPGSLALVTGANTGIGKETAVELSRKGWRVILAGRSEERTQPVVDYINNDIIAKQAKNKAEFMKLDLSSLKSVKEFASNFIQKDLPLNLLVNNAGIMALPSFEKTVDGYEKQIATNHLGHYYLTRLLLPVIKKSTPARIVSISSEAHRYGKREDLEDLSAPSTDPSKYSPWRNYGISKLCNIALARQLCQELKKEDLCKPSGILVNSVHPGVVNTELTRNLSSWISFLVPVLKLFLITPLKGALTQLYVSTSPDFEENDGIYGKYYVPYGKLGNPIPEAYDDDLALKVWNQSEEMIKKVLGDDAFTI